jgi:hypothetical protein
MLTKWKYMTQQFPTEGLTVPEIVERRHAEMSLMGEYGWELVSTTVYHSPDTGLDVLILFYKKPVSDILTTPAPRGR